MDDFAPQSYLATKPGDARPYVFDMETGDPDDVLTLLLLGAHPRVELRAVTVTPGSAEQVAMVRWILSALGLGAVKIGAQEWPKNADKECMKGRFYDNFGRLREEGPECRPAADVLREACDDETTLVTGAPLHNLGAALELPGFRLGRWVAQGGFAGEGVVPPDLQMDKFKGLTVCPTFNFNGNRRAAEAALRSPAIGRRVLVSKNVCHRAVYDAAVHDAFGRAAQAAQATGPHRRAVALKLLHSAMGKYLQRQPGGKKLHDPLALATALRESVCRLAEVEVFAEKGGWGSRLCVGSGTWISVDYDEAAFLEALLEGGPAAE